MTRKVLPVRPSEVVKLKKESIPDEVIEAFNEMIAAHFLGSYACFRQSEVIALIVAKGLPRGKIFSSGWLDVEDIYRDAGWEVEYDKPGYNESYPATFTFRKKSRD
jgi:hypothetical protein